MCPPMLFGFLSQGQKKNEKKESETYQKIEPKKKEGEKNILYRIIR